MISKTALCVAGLLVVALAASANGLPGCTELGVTTESACDAGCVNEGDQFGYFQINVGEGALCLCDNGQGLFELCIPDGQLSTMSTQEPANDQCIQQCE